jgi:hypothetical protein
MTKQQHSCLMHVSGAHENVTSRHICIRQARLSSCECSSCHTTRSSPFLPSLRVLQGIRPLPPIFLQRTCTQTFVQLTRCSRRTSARRRFGFRVNGLGFRAFPDSRPALRTDAVYTNGVLFCVFLTARFTKSDGTGGQVQFSARHSPVHLQPPARAPPPRQQSGLDPLLNYLSCSSSINA